MELLLATNNPGKVREYQAILAALFPDLTLRTLREAGIDHEVEETGDSFEANARLKATAYGALSGLPVIADDSGLAVAGLDGFPGVASHRWAGPLATEPERNRLLLARMAGIPEGERGATFVCVAIFRLPDGRERSARGELHGQIGLEPRGEHGFGYDPLFVLPERGLALAELPAAEKNGLSHRGRAARALAGEIRALLDGGS